MDDRKCLHLRTRIRREAVGFFGVLCIWLFIYHLDCTWEHVRPDYFRHLMRFAPFMVCVYVLTIGSMHRLARRRGDNPSANRVSGSK